MLMSQRHSAMINSVSEFISNDQGCFSADSALDSAENEFFQCQKSELNNAISALNFSETVVISSETALIFDGFRTTIFGHSFNYFF